MRHFQAWRAASTSLGIAAAWLLAAGCAQLPSAELVSELRSLQQVNLAGSRGPLSSQRSAEILERLRRISGDIDILQKHIALEEAVAGAPLTVGNKVTLLQDGPATYAAMSAAIGKAKDHINLEIYIIDDDEIGRKFADLLLQKQAQGVQVNIIYDSVGALRTPRSYFERLKAGGVRVLEFNPVNPMQAKAGWKINQRDHRKLLIVDGSVVFLGGLNISSVYSPGSSGLRRGSEGDFPWRDTHVQIEGPVVADFQKLFLQAWSDQRGEALAPRNYLPALIARGKGMVRALADSPEDGAGIIYLTLLSAIMNAEKQVYITNAYFVPDEQLLQALIDAARRGVDVRLVLPSRSDFWAVLHAGRSHYARLLDGGVRIYERRLALLHSKTAVVDGVWSCVGSANLDWRSFLHNHEVNAVVLGAEFASQMLGMFESDLGKSIEVDIEQWKSRPLNLRLREWVARLWEYWL